MKEFYGITTEEIENTRRWEEGRVTIDIEKETLDFDVFHEYLEEEADEIIEDYGNNEFKKINMDFNNISFEDVYYLKAFIDKSIYNSQYYFYNEKDKKYIGLIE